MALISFALAPRLGVYGSLIFLVPAFWFWVTGRRNASWIFLFSASWLLDMLSPLAWPVNLITSLLAALIYLNLIANAFSHESTLNRFIGLAIWLTVWRLTRLVLLATSWAIGLDRTFPSFMTWYVWLSWVVVGLALWAFLSLLRKLVLRWPGFKLFRRHYGK